MKASGATPADSAPISSADHRALTDNALLVALVGGRAARRVTGRLGGIRAAALAGDADLAVAGLTGRQVAVLRAAVELGVRAVAAPLLGRRLCGPSDVALHFGPRLALEPVEVFCGAALDVRHRVVRDFSFARGSLTGVEVHPRDIFRELIRSGAAAVIFCHNHPSGDPTPSRQDVELTVRLREVGELCGISVLDHVVVAAGAWRSVCG